MTQLVVPIPNLLGGVSQQGIRRLSNQVVQQDNAWASPLDGMRKRHPIDHIATLAVAPAPRAAKIHTIVRGAERYIVSLQVGAVQAFYPDGTAIDVKGPTTPYTPDFSYLDLRHENLLNFPEAFGGWNTADEALAVTSTTVRGPLDFGSADRLGNDYETIGAKGIYWQSQSGGTTGERKHFSLYVRAVNDDELTAVRLKLTEAAVWSGGCTFTYSASSSSWIAGTPDPLIQAEAEVIGEGWCRLKITYTPDAVTPTALSRVDIEVIGTGALGPDKLVDVWGAQLVDDDGYSLASFPPYLSGSISDVRATSVQDFTFVSNKAVAVQKGTTATPANPGDKDQVFIWVRQGSYKQEYTVTLNATGTGARTVTVNTWDGVTAVGSEISSITTQDIAAALAHATTGLGQYAELAVTQEGNLIRVQPTTGTNDIESLHLADSFGDEGMVAITDEVAHFADLPLEFLDGMRIKVAGDPSRGEDDYWVEFNEDKGAPGAQVFAVGKWHETAAPEILTSIDPDTMPHTLVRKYDDGAGTVTGTPNSLYFEWGPATWTDRAVGDDDSNPWPSFVSITGEPRYVTDVSFHKGRLGLLSGANCVLSTVSDVFLFFRTTVRALLDGDRIDVSVSHRQVAELHAAVPFNERLALFSRNTMFSLTGEPVLTPRTVEVSAVLEEESSPEAVPVAVGSSLIFVSQKGDYALVREAFPLTERTTFRSADLTAQVPRYVSGVVKDIAATSLEGEMVVAFRADGDLSKLYIYKAFGEGRERIQSAWWRYPLGTDVAIAGFGWLDDALYLAVERGGVLYLEAMRVGSGLADPNSAFQVCLDRRVTDEDTSPAYTPATGTTDYTMPYDVTSASAVRVVTRATEAGEGGLVLQVADVDLTPGANVVKVHGDHTSEAVWIGEAFDMAVAPGRPTVRSQTITGGYAPSLEGNEVVTGGSLWLSGPVHLDMVVERAHGQSTRELFRDPPLGSGPTVGVVSVAARGHEFSVLAEPDEVTITLESDSHFSTSIQALEWYVNKQGRARRLPG